jgi:hypothetical protein
MRRVTLSTVPLAASIILPALVFVLAYGLLRPLSPSSEEEHSARDDFTEDERIEQIIDAFTLYAEAFDNRFPDVERFYGDELMAAVRDRLDLPALAGHSPRGGFGHLTRLQRTNATFAYHGAGAKRGDVRRVLVHWSLEDGKAVVIFCDLSYRRVFECELPALLSPWRSLADQCVVRIGDGGSGTVVSPEGFIVTADHVVPADGSDVRVRFADGRVTGAELIGRSRKLDIAVLRIGAPQPLPFARLEPRHVRDDEPAWIAGYGGGVSEALIREVRTVRYVLDELITTWNRVRGGDSGGPVLDASGCLIGVVLGPGDLRPRTCRTTAAHAILERFPALREPGDTARK